MCGIGLVSQRRLCRFPPTRQVPPERPVFVRHWPNMIRPAGFIMADLYMLKQALVSSRKSPVLLTVKLLSPSILLTLYPAQYNHANESAKIHPNLPGGIKVMQPALPPIPHSFLKAASSKIDLPSQEPP